MPTPPTRDESDPLDDLLQAVRALGALLNADGFDPTGNEVHARRYVEASRHLQQTLKQSRLAAREHLHRSVVALHDEHGWTYERIASSVLDSAVSVAHDLYRGEREPKRRKGRTDT